MKLQKKKNMPDRLAVRWIYEKTKGQRLRLLALVVSHILNALLSVWFALICKGLIDGAVTGDREKLLWYARGLLAVILEIATGMVSNAVTEWITVRQTAALQKSLLNAALKNDYSQIVAFHSGELMNRMFSDVGIVVNGIVTLVPSAFYLLFRLLGAVAVLIALAPGFTLLFLLVGILICCGMTLIRSKVKHLHKQVQASGGNLRSFLQETISSLLVIRAFGAEERVCDKAADYQNQYCLTRKKRWLVSLLGNLGFQTIFQLGYFLAMVWGCFGIFSGSLSYGTLTAMLQLVNQIQGPFAGFSGLITRFYAVTASAERLMEIENLPKAQQSPVSCEEYYANLEKIIFDHVDFTYGRTPVLRNVCTEISKGDIVSITGISGGGKSTIFLLLLGAYQPTAGSILVQTEDGKTVLRENIRGLYAYVPQGNYLFSGTLRENMTFLQKDIPDEKIWEALAVSCADSFVYELPQGLDTPLGEKGHGLSEGQMQRIAIARAILSQAPILLLDEATSALDEDTEALLLKNIQSLQNRTCLVVTHRKAALSICSKHLVLENGSMTSE